MRIAALLCFPLLLSAQEPAGPRAVVEIQATWTLLHNGRSETKTFTLKTPCKVQAGASQGMENLPPMVAGLVPGLIPTWSATVDKDREGEMSATYSEKVSEGVRFLHHLESRLVGGLNGSFGLSPSGKTDELVMTATSIFTGMFNGSETTDGRLHPWREAEGLTYLPGDLLNPMEPLSPRAKFSIKELQDGMASGKPFTLKADKTYDVELKGNRYKGSYTITVDVTP